MIKRTGKKQVDLTLAIVIILLTGIGFIAVTSAAYPMGLKYFDNGLYYAKREFVYLILGTLALLFTANIPRSVLKKWALPAFGVSILMVLLLWTPLGDTSKGQARWLLIKQIGLRLQPSDFVKVTSILFMAQLLEKYRNEMGDMRNFVTLLGVMGISVVPIMVRDFSTALVIGVGLLSMYFIAGLKPHQFVTMLGAGIVLIFTMLTQEKYRFRMKRILGFIAGTEADQIGDNYQINQSLYAIAMGGFGGVGLFRSRQKYYNLAEAHNDFIFAIICEEVGLIGGLVVIALFFIFVARGYVVAKRVKNYYDKYVAVGITTYIGVQAIFNIGVGVGAFPVTGITLPFISYGGTSLIVTMASVGLLLRISKDV